MNPTIGVLSLQGDVGEHIGALQSVGADTCTVRTRAELDRVDGLVIPGGESTTIDKLLKIFDLRDPLRQRIREGLPVYGSCAGMILLANQIVDGTADQETLGGIDMTVRRNAFGRQVDSFESDLDIAGVDGPPLRAVFIRAPIVERVGPGVDILATAKAATGADRIVAVRQSNLLATSFHPEVTGDRRIHELFVRIVTEEQ
ncbi:5'-phosphate synthase pdxT subunit [Micrococcales bacterium KH10]|nr:5'-phosphate synthase pdxT subunit [Micrococcales bacterium KH10]